MKTIIHKYIIGFALCILFFSCEKNDLCDGVDVETPRVYIEFRDRSDVSQLKAVPYIETSILGDEKKIIENNVSKVLIPLKPETTSTTWVFNVYNNNSENKVLIGSDTIKFTYLPDYIYISRACGFKTNFSSLSYQRVSQESSWIFGININQTTISNEENAHIEFYY